MFMDGFYGLCHTDVMTEETMQWAERLITQNIVYFKPLSLI